MAHFFQIFIVAVIPLLFAITVHEAAHGFVASKLGDKTALMMGRVTLNPIKHIDPIGTILLPMIMLYLGGVIFGWAKPVPVNWQNLNNPKRDAAFVAAAGPISNLLMAVMWMLIIKLTIIVVGNVSPTDSMSSIIAFLFATSKFGITINSVLMILNLIPIPPLDGSRIVSSILPDNVNYYYNKIEPYGIWVLLGLLVTGALQWILWPPVQLLINVLMQWSGLPVK